MKYSNNCSKTSGSLWQHDRDQPNTSLASSESFKFKVKITGGTPDDGNIKDVKTLVLLSYLSNFGGALEMP